MAVGRDPSVSGNIRKHQQDLDRLGSAPLGPVSLGVGDSIRAGGAFRLDQAGAYLLSRGSVTGLSGLVDGIRDTNDAQSGRLNDQEGWIVGHGTRLDGIDTMNDAQNGRLNDHTGWIAGHTARLDAVDATNDAQNGRLNDHSGWIVSAANAASTAQSRADSAYTRAGTGISDAATAQARADSAYSRAGTGISNAATAQARAETAVTLAGNARDDAAALRTQVRNWIAQARTDNPSLPPNIPA